MVQDKTLFIRKLRQWYKKYHRLFPWRVSTNPYEILVSEYLLQKTNADRVVRTYTEFIKKFPDLKSLAKAKPDKLNLLISKIGLSYRAERLKNAAIQLVKDYEGKVPDDRKELLKLNGSGLYISNAILCFAFYKHVAIIDTNTIRIFGRIFDIKSNLKRPRTDRNLESKIEVYLPIKNVRDFNYALLDFGAIVCLSKRPKCFSCPLTSICNYYQEFGG